MYLDYGRIFFHVTLSYYSLLHLHVLQSFIHLAESVYSTSTPCLHQYTLPVEAELCTYAPVLRDNIFASLEELHVIRNFNIRRGECQPKKEGTIYRHQKCHSSRLPTDTCTMYMYTYKRNWMILTTIMYLPCTYPGMSNIVLRPMNCLHLPGCLAVVG